MKVIALSGISRRAGGLFYAVSSLCKGLKAEGADMTVLGADKHFSDHDRAVWNPVRVVSYPSFGPLASSLELPRLLTQTDADLIHQHGIWLADQRSALQWQKKNDRPVIISPHGMLDPWAVKNSAWKKKLVGRWFAHESLQKASCIHALCRSEADSIRAYGLKNRIAIIPNGVDLPDVGNARIKQEGRKKLLFLGRIHPKKGLKQLIQAYSVAKHQAPGPVSGWQLLIAGWDDGNYLAGLRQIASEAGLLWSDAFSAPGEPELSHLQDYDVCFVGPQFGKEKEALLRAADAFILPSFSEGLPMSILEAWSYGLPVIMTEFCNIPEGFEANAAVNVNPEVKSISAGIDRIVSMTESELFSMGVKGRKLVEDKFTWDKIAHDMKSVYEDSLSD